MGLLDDLKKEADQLKNAPSEQELKRREKEKHYNDTLLPAMQ